MAKRKHFQDLEEILALSMLSRVSMTHKEVWDELIKLTDGAVSYSSNYITGILFRLRSDQYIQQFSLSGRQTHYAITDAGREELLRLLALYRSYDNFLHPLTDNLTPANPCFLRTDLYERSFSAHMEESEHFHEDAESLLLSLSRAAFKAGWVAAGGKNPSE